MTPKATIFKAQLQISDMDRHYYEPHALTLARHPSETDERMMMRLLAFVLRAHERLEFTRGLSAVDEPELWQKSLTGDIELWIDLGQPDERRLRKASSISEQVLILAYGRSAPIWWEKIRPELERFNNLSALYVPPAASEAMAAWAERNMDLQVMIEDGQVWITRADETIEVPLEKWLSIGG